MRTSSTEPLLPLELSDQIIDHYAPSSADVYIPNDNERMRIRTLLSLVRCCYSFSHRTRRYLYSIIWIHSKDTLSRLLSTLRSNPPTRSLISMVAISPLLWRSIDKPMSEFLPLAVVLGIQSQIKHLMFTNYRWDSAKYPWSYYAQIGHIGRCVAHLRLSAVAFPSELEFLRFIGSFQHLTHLALGGIYFDNPLTNREAQRPWSNPSLRILEVGGIRGFPFVHLLGNAIEEFRLSAHIGGSLINPNLQTYRECVSDYVGLKSLRITVKPWVRLTPAGTIDEDGRVWPSIHDYIYEIFRAVRSTALHTIQIGLIPQQQHPGIIDRPERGETAAASAPWDLPRYYLHTRAGMLDAIFAEDIHDILVSPAFENLKTLDFHVSENSRQHDKEWWKGRIQTRLPGLATNIGINADIHYGHDSTYNTLWSTE